MAVSRVARVSFSREADRDTPECRRHSSPSPKSECRCRTTLFRPSPRSGRHSLAQRETLGDRFPEIPEPRRGDSLEHPDVRSVTAFCGKSFYSRIHVAHLLPQPLALRVQHQRAAEPDSQAAGTLALRGRARPRQEYPRSRRRWHRKSSACADSLAADHHPGDSDAGDQGQQLTLVARNLGPVSVAGRVWNVQRQPVAAASGHELHRQSGPTPPEAQFRGRIPRLAEEFRSAIQPTIRVRLRTAAVPTALRSDFDRLPSVARWARLLRPLRGLAVLAWLCDAATWRLTASPHYHHGGHGVLVSTEFSP